MTWLAANWKHVLTIVAVVGTIVGMTARAHYLGIADAHADRIETLEADLGVMADLTQDALIEARQESERADTAEARAERVQEETERQREEDAATIDRLNARLAESDAVEPVLADAVQEEAVENDGWIRIETHHAYVENLERTILTTDSLRQVERAGRLQERARGDAREAEADAAHAENEDLAVAVSRLTSQLEQSEAIVEEQAMEIDALRSATRSGGGAILDIDFSRDPYYVGAGILIGFFLTR